MNNRLPGTTVAGHPTRSCSICLTPIRPGDDVVWVAASAFLVAPDSPSGGYVHTSCARAVACTQQPA